jgi:hypothetical protein
VLIGVWSVYWMFRLMCRKFSSILLERVPQHCHCMIALINQLMRVICICTSHLWNCDIQFVLKSEKKRKGHFAIPRSACCPDPSASLTDSSVSYTITRCFYFGAAHKARVCLVFLWNKGFKEEFCKILNLKTVLDGARERNWKDG